MSSLLRSTKFVRYFTGAARTLVLNTAKTADANLLVNPKALCSANSILLRDYATTKKNESLDPLLTKLDLEVRKYGRIAKKDIDEIFEEIRTKSDITSSQSLLVIRCCGELVPEELPEERTLLVQKIWNVLTERGIPMDISHYNALLRVYLENEHPFSPAKFLEELETKGLQPNRVTYQRLMWRYCQEGDVQGATKVLEKMRELNFPVSEPVLNALVMGHAFYGDMSGAKIVLETMAGAGLEPTNRTFTYLACGYARKGDTDGVNSVIELAKKKDVVMTDKDMFDVIEHLAINGHNDKIHEILPHLQKGFGYNQDACNLILRILNKGHIDTAKEVLKTMPKTTNYEDTPFKGAFFVKQLVKINKPADEIIKICMEVKNENLIPNSIYLALEASLQQGKTELALKLLPIFKSQGHEVRQHYFWPLLVQKGKEHDEEGLLHIIREMCKENLVPSGEALRDYVIPYMLEKDLPENVILKLQIANVPIIHSARNVMINLLEKTNMKQASDIALKFQPKGQYSLVSRPLLNALAKTNDIDSFLKIVHVISSTGPNTNNEDASIDEVQKDDNVPSNEIGRLIKSGVKNLREPALCENLLDQAHSKGLRISSQAAEEIQQFLGDNMTSKISDLLSQLLSSDLEPKPLQSVRFAVTKSSGQLENILEQAITSGNTNNVKVQKQLLTAYMTENNVEKLHKYVEELKNSTFELSPTTMAQIYECYVLNDEISKAEEIYAYIKSKYPDFTLNRHKMVVMAYALIKAGKYDDAVKFIKENKPVEDLNVNFQINSKCWQMLNILAEQKDSEKVKELTILLIENNYAETTNVIFGPLIKVNLLKDDLDAALNEFEFCCKNYRTTPWKGELMKALILKENAPKLQWLADLGTQIHGEVNILHDLVLAFVECGRLRQARRILETPGLHSKQIRLETACKRYVEEGQSEHLEGLLEATRELSHIDRSNIFYSLLVTYCKSKETDKAVGLWTLLQEEGEVPSTKFLIYLGNHLKSQNLPVPFVVPEEVGVTQSTHAKPVKKPANTPPKKPTAPAVQNQISRKQISEEIETMIKAGSLALASDTVIKHIQNGQMPMYRVFKFLLKELAESGDIEKLQLIGNLVNDEVKREITFDNKMTQAIFVRGAGNQHVNDLYETVKGANNDEELQNALKKFPRSATLALVIENPELEEKCLKIVELANSKGIVLPANLIWMEYLLMEKHEKANEIFEKYLQNTEVIVFRRLLQESHKRNQPQLIEKLIEQLKTNKNINAGTYGNAYSRLINYYILQNQPENSYEVLEKALKSGIEISHINNTSLKRLKSALEEKGVEFKYAL